MAIVEHLAGNEVKNMITVQDIGTINIKKYLQDHNIKQWEIAEAASVGDATLCRWLRRNLEKTAPANQQRVIDAINQLSK